MLGRDAEPVVFVAGAVGVVTCATEMERSASMVVVRRVLIMGQAESYVNRIADSLMKGRACDAIFEPALLARCMKTRDWEMRCFRNPVKSEWCNKARDWNDEMM